MVCVTGMFTRHLKTIIPFGKEVADIIDWRVKVRYTTLLSRFDLLVKIKYKPTCVLELCLSVRQNHILSMDTRVWQKPTEAFCEKQSPTWNSYILYLLLCFIIIYKLCTLYTLYQQNQMYFFFREPGHKYLPAYQIQISNFYGLIAVHRSCLLHILWWFRVLVIFQRRDDCKIKWPEVFSWQILSELKQLHWIIVWQEQGRLTRADDSTRETRNLNGGGHSCTNYWPSDYCHI